MTIVVGSDIAHYCGRIGAFDNRMAYVLGLQRLGHDVYLFADVDPSRCFDAQHNRVNFEQWPGRQQFESLAKSYGVWGRCCLICNGGATTHGMSFSDARRVAERADLLVNIDGMLKTPAIFDRIRVRAYVDLAPGKTQVLCDEAGADTGLARHHHFFSVGLNLGMVECALPTCGVQWKPIIHPVVLDRWPMTMSDSCRRFTTISNWAGKITFNFQGQYSGEKADSWRDYLDLPRRTRQELEIALHVKPRYQDDLRVFREKGWHLADPGQLRFPEDYRRYIAGSRAEFSVANHRYVTFRTGWHSDRTVRYLASGKPVLLQRTGLERSIAVGEGLLTFDTVDEAVEGIDAINKDYAKHCEAARRLAEKHCGAERVLSGMLQQMDLPYGK